MGYRHLGGLRSMSSLRHRAPGRAPTFQSFLALALTSAVAAGVMSPAGAAAEPSSAADRRDAAAGDSPRVPRTDTVTLVTGDVVRVITTADGRRNAVVVPDAADPAPGAVVRRVGEDLHVLPTEALPWVAAGRLDSDLFNVTRLVKDGFADGDTDSLPLVLGFTGGAVAARATGEPASGGPVRVAAPAGSTLRRALPVLGAGAVEARKSSARTFWRSIDTALRSAGGSSGAAVSRGFGAGVETVWLDGRVRANLDRSVRQIGAPAAHARGWTAGASAWPCSTRVSMRRTRR